MKIVSIVMNYIWTDDPEEKAKQIAKRRTALQKVGVECASTDEQEEAPTIPYYD